MRIVLLLGCVMLASMVRAQGVLPILYYIPPTSGCNGLVAIDLPTWNGCVGGGTGGYMITPMGCASFAWWAVADTAFIPICSDPCEIVILDDFGNACMCSVGFTTSVSEVPVQARLGLFRTGGDLLITSTIPLTSPLCRIYGSSGQLIFERSLPTGSKWEFPIHSMSQLLIVTIISHDQVLTGHI
ncbi:MAG: hypothetical protein JST38_01445 [Bacteroidetes bacterium]|nr:hypothetical protein [Bacteroidota bacterium]